MKIPQKYPPVLIAVVLPATILQKRTLFCLCNNKNRTLGLTNNFLSYMSHE